MRITIKKGLSLPVAGEPDQTIEAANPVRSVALLGADYVGLKPRMLVQEGDDVRLGQALFIDKRDPEVKFTSPGTGRVAAINRGARRALQSVVVELEDSTGTTAAFANIPDGDPASLQPDAIRRALFDSGMWTAFRTRPYSKVPQSDSTPRSIFVTAIDSEPLAPSPAVIVAAHTQAFGSGLQIITRLTAGPVYLCTASDWQGPTGERERIRHAVFSGPHPAGLPGTHIHHLDPVGAGRTVWHIGYQDVIAIGKLFGEGRIDLERTVALGGAGFERPRLVTTRAGANVTELSAGQLTGASQRLISGSVLDGRRARGAEAFLGRYHVQVSAIAESRERRLFGWLGVRDPAYSFSGLLKRRQDRGNRRPFTSGKHGRQTALMPVEAFERIVPLDILPVPLLHALLIKDTDQAQALGCLELDPADLALCSFVCPGKIDYGAALRVNLEQIERDG